MNVFSKKVTTTNRQKGYFNVPVDYKKYFSSYDKGNIDIFLEDSPNPIIGSINFTAQTKTESPRIYGKTSLQQWFSNTPNEAYFSVEILQSFIRIRLKE